AFLKNYRQSPRKVALVAELIKGKRVAEALIILDHLPKRASLPVKKLLVSAISNAKNLGVNEENLVVGNATVNKGVVLKRIMPRARGSASRINKRTSHIELTLKEVLNTKKSKKVVAEKTEEPKEKKISKKPAAPAKSRASQAKSASKKTEVKE
ncbi:MAG: 50S ribosomal protein L22, partial [Candidatus Moranbacteria bacterium]|nr:50S ribosomal protein L22 [Candidatus Moranbacteria bacterium]